MENIFDNFQIWMKGITTEISRSIEILCVCVGGGGTFGPVALQNDIKHWGNVLN